MREEGRFAQSRRYFVLCLSWSVLASVEEKADHRLSTQ